MNPMINLLLNQLEQKDPKKAHLIKMMMQKNVTPDQAIKQALENGDISAQDYQQFKSAYKQGRIPIISITENQFAALDKVVSQQTNNKNNKSTIKTGFRF